EQGPPVKDVASAMRQVLENPLRFPPLRRALTPDDHVTIVLDEDLPRLGEMLTPLLEHVASARVSPEAITLLSPKPAAQQHWLDDLPETFQDVRVETHDPADRKKLSYLATTKRGRRVYLNRSLVDADQLVILSRRRYDPLLGYSGLEDVIFPALGDEA